MGSWAGRHFLHDDAGVASYPPYVATAPMRGNDRGLLTLSEHPIGGASVGGQLYSV